MSGKDFLAEHALHDAAGLAQHWFAVNNALQH